MAFRIKRKYKGDEFTFYVSLIANTRNCTVRKHCTTDEIPAKISQDLKSISLQKSVLIKGLHDESPKQINTLKIPKDYLSHVRDYVLGI